MNDNIIIIVLCLIFILMFFLTIYYKKEKFTQCQELEDAHINGLCKPFSGIPPAHAISPYYHLESSSYKHEPDESERIKKNKDAAREICNNTPGCGGISQAVKENGTNETYLCQNDWDGSQVITFDTYPMKTYKCKNQTFVNKGLTNNVLLSSNKNLEDFGKNFNQFIYNKHEGLKFPQQNLINIEGTNNPIKLTLKCQVDRREYYIETNLKKYIDFANTMKNCIGFHIKKTYDGYDVYFGTKIKNVELILDSDSNCITYSVKFIHYQNCTCQNNEWDVETHHNCSSECRAPFTAQAKQCTATSDRICRAFNPVCSRPYNFGNGFFDSRNNSMPYFLPREINQPGQSRCGFSSGNGCRNNLKSSECYSRRSDCLSSEVNWTRGSGAGSWGQSHVGSTCCCA